MIDDNCGKSKSTKLTGYDKQCLKKPTIAYALAKSDQSFADADAFRSKSAWDTEKQNKDIVMMYLADQSELANEDPTYYEGRVSKFKTKEGRKGLRIRHLLGYCSHSALLSYEESEYNYIYEIKEDGQAVGIEQEDGSIKGQELSNFLVGIVQESVIGGDVQHCFVDIIFADPNEVSNSGAIVNPNFNLLKYKGIYPAQLEVVGTPTATEIVLRATSGCSGNSLTGLESELAKFNFLKANGTDNSPDSVTAGTGDDTNLYTFVGTGLETGTVELDVVAQTLAMFGTDEKTAYTIS